MPWLAEENQTLALRQLLVGAWQRQAAAVSRLMEQTRGRKRVSSTNLTLHRAHRLLGWAGWGEMQQR
jgi:hypothetical protein